MKNMQKGFALVEALLVILIVAVVGFGGYYVWHTQKNSNSTASNAATAKTSKPAQTSAQTSAQNYFSIPEWGVRAPFTASLTPEYSITTQGNWTWAYFSSKELNLSDSSCTTDGGYGGVINRIAAGQKLMGADGGASDQTIEAAISSGVIKDYSHVGNYYYYYEHSQAACGQSDYSQTIQQETETAISGLAKDLQAIPN